jgi:hypothetical protein
VAESYHAARSRRDPDWRLRAIAGARERERARRERDPEAFRARRREATARTRAWQGEHGFSFERENDLAIYRDGEITVTTHASPHLGGAALVRCLSGV